MAGYSTPVKILLLNTVIAQGAWISMHTDDPLATGINEVSGSPYARVQTTWGTPAGTDQAPATVTGTTPVVISIPANTTITHWGLWSAQTGGSWVTGWILPKPAIYTSTSGIYTITPVLSQAG